MWPNPQLTRDAADTDDDAMPPAKRPMFLQQGMEAESKAHEKSNFKKSSLASNKVERLDEEKVPINISPASSIIYLTISWRALSNILLESSNKAILYRTINSGVFTRTEILLLGRPTPTVAKLRTLELRNSGTVYQVPAALE